VKGFLHKPLSPEMIEKSVTAAVATAQPAPSEIPQAAAVAAEQPATAGRTFVGFVRDVAMFLASPFIGLAFIALFPLIGLGMLAWMGGRAWRQRATAN
jgi:hypothetical protein